MATAIPALVEPSILRWARVRANLELTAAARRIKTEPEVLTAWEDGSSLPTITEVRRAAAAYNRPLAVFFLPQPPQDWETLRDYRRSLPGLSMELSGALRAEYGRAHLQRETLIDLGELDDSAPSTAWRIAIPTSDDEIAAVARQALLAVGPKPFPRGAASEYEHLNFWTSALEEAGVLVMATAGGRVEVKEMRAFSLYFDQLPVIALNGSDWARGRLFSLIHEYAHLLLHTAGICDTRTDRRTSSAERLLEGRCNKIAAAALMPADLVLSSGAVRQHERGEPWTVGDLTEAARPFGVSVEAYLRRLLTLGRVEQRQYEEFRARAKSDLQPKKPSGGDFYITKSRDLGRGYVRTVYDAHRRALIDTYTAATYLDVKAAQMERLASAARL